MLLISSSAEHVTHFRKAAAVLLIALERRSGFTCELDLPAEVVDLRGESQTTQVPANTRDQRAWDRYFKLESNTQLDYKHIQSGAEKLQETFAIKYEQYSNIKDIISVKGSKKKLLSSLLRPQEGASSEILLMHVSTNQ